MNAETNEEIIFDGLLTRSEVRRLQEAVRRNGSIDETEAEKLVSWASKRLSEATCVSLLIDGWLTVGAWDGEQPQLIPTADGFGLINSAQSETKKLEEMRCGVS